MPRPLDDGFTQDYPTPHLDAMDAANEIERLNDMLIRQANVIEKIQDERDALKAEIENLYAERAALRLDRDLMKADAERYRYMRDNPITFEGSGIVIAWRSDELDAKVDAAIDAARGE